MRNQHGFSMLELALASAIGFIVLLSVGRLLVFNSVSIERGRDKAVLQANTSEALEWMARSVRRARTLEVVGANELRTYDSNGILEHAYTLNGQRLQQDGTDLVDRICTQFQVLPNADTTSVRLVVELEDDQGNRMTVRTDASVRNRTFEF